MTLEIRLGSDGNGGWGRRTPQLHQIDDFHSVTLGDSFRGNLTVSLGSKLGGTVQELKPRRVVIDNVPIGHLPLHDIPELVRLGLFNSTGYGVQLRTQLLSKMCYRTVHFGANHFGCATPDHIDQILAKIFSIFRCNQLSVLRHFRSLSVFQLLEQLLNLGVLFLHLSVQARNLNIQNATDSLKTLPPIRGIVFTRLRLFRGGLRRLGRARQLNDVRGRGLRSSGGIINRSFGRLTGVGRLFNARGRIQLLLEGFRFFHLSLYCSRQCHIFVLFTPTYGYDSTRGLSIRYGQLLMKKCRLSAALLFERGRGLLDKFVDGAKRAERSLRHVCRAIFVQGSAGAQVIHLKSSEVFPQWSELGRQLQSRCTLKYRYIGLPHTHMKPRFWFGVKGFLIADNTIAINSTSDGLRTPRENAQCVRDNATAYRCLACAAAETRRGRTFDNAAYRYGNAAAQALILGVLVETETRTALDDTTADRTADVRGPLT